MKVVNKAAFERIPLSVAVIGSVVLLQDVYCQVLSDGEPRGCSVLLSNLSTGIIGSWLKTVLVTPVEAEVNIL